MKDAIFTNSCRICLTTNKKLRSLYKPIDEGDEPPNEMLHLITGIQVEKIDEHVTLPKNICKNCELSLNMAYEFRVNALKSQEIILDHLKELNKNNLNEEENINQIFKSNDKNEYEQFMDLEPLEVCQNTLEENITEGNLENLTDDELENSALINEEEEECEEQEHTSYLIDEQDGNEIDIYSDHHDHQNNEDEELGEYEESQQIEIQCEENDDQLEETVEADDEEYIPERTNVSPKILKEKPPTVVLRKKEKPLGEKTYTNARFNNKQIPRRGRKPTNTINKAGYICDICGNIYSKRGRMTEHRQRHDKELRFNCEVCNEKFYTRELLRKHMFSHSGGKPLKCEYCSRTFYYESVRKAHEAVHKGHKPYICDVCGKAFGYAHALKKHKLIHAEIKLYRCVYCNKDFRLQHHMKQHELTKLHQNAVRFAKSESANIEDVDVGVSANDIIEKGQNINDEILFVEEITEDQLASGS